MRYVASITHGKLLILGLGLVFTAGFSRCLLRGLGTHYGYELGQLQKRETKLLLERNALTLRLAELSTKENLEAIIAAKEPTIGAKKQAPLALK